MGSDEEKISNIFRKIAWLDKNRWLSEPDDNNPNLINFSSNDLKNSEKILTHFLCYISDRQMPFSQIWDKAGFVYSDIVHSYSQKECVTTDLFNPFNENSFIHRRKDDGTKFELISNDGSVTFTPRYYPSDIKSILQTLMILEEKEYNKDIIQFIARIISEFDGDFLVKRIGFALHLLAYYNIGQPKASEYEKYEEMLKKIEKNKSEVLGILRNKDKFEQKFEDFKKNKNGILFNQKRMWCSLRDYIKYDETCNYMINGLKDIKEDSLIETWNNLDRTELELPGDVWNNNSKFRKCLFKNISMLSSLNKYESPRFIREIYTKLKSEIDEGYPESFDVTFDFVPRMCEKGMCDFCIFNENNKIDELCTKDKSKYCPILLVSCGYKNKCNPKECVAILADD
ncbi:MAG: hypothetical protein K8R11_11015 [Methanococcoides sp.]|nr:hypothetical protein [Methanococcoides sp.]